MKTEIYIQFQLGFLFTVTKWYKGERNIVVSLPFIDISWNQIHKDFKEKKK